ncbi:hypothetical protein AVEN_48167-1 [Araneus ventricosus]|uniref:Uncharacterized protein n=1 Tax=Araneus ventricosus TaxID=182803 RepID=A0A4Y2ILQ7_ARAVE|nr:hypothetical protein AVEN_48167-1 [Araneus ventricosus]
MPAVSCLLWGAKTVFWLLQWRPPLGSTSWEYQLILLTDLTFQEEYNNFWCSFCWNTTCLIGRIQLVLYSSLTIIGRVRRFYRKRSLVSSWLQTYFKIPLKNIKQNLKRLSSM